MYKQFKLYKNIKVSDLIEAIESTGEENDTVYIRNDNGEKLSFFLIRAESLEKKRGSLGFCMLTDKELEKYEVIKGEDDEN